MPGERNLHSICVQTSMIKKTQDDPKSASGLENKCTTGNFRSVVVTPNHRIVAPRVGQSQSMPASHINNGDRIVRTNGEHPARLLQEPFTEKRATVSWRKGYVK